MLFGKKSDRPRNPPASSSDSIDYPEASTDASVEYDSVLHGGGIEELTVRVPAPGRPKVMSISIKDRKTLHAAYMPFLKTGGIFVPSSSQYKMGDEIFLLLRLLDSPENISVSGKIVWITPEGAMGNRAEGIGIQFTGPEAGKIRSKIEGILGGALKSRRMTHTL
ncbi:MAG: hypothetical protein DHS20C01_06240 [marine bacterium B5-7]|nr:MAG: hypothetical protein DHS20C01_06240 [marine bacterium B5-7]